MLKIGLFALKYQKMLWVLSKNDVVTSLLVTESTIFYQFIRKAFLGQVTLNNKSKIILCLKVILKTSEAYMPPPHTPPPPVNY